MPSDQLGRVQLRIMQTLWDKGRATAREITDALNDEATAVQSPIAHSTVQTLLRGLEEKRAISHESQGRTFVFFPLVERDNYQRSAASDLLERVFGGRVSDLVAHLLKHEDVSRDELDRIRQLIKNRRKP